MKKIFAFVAGVGLSLLVSYNAKPMAVYFDGMTGNIVDTEIVIPQCVNLSMASMLTHIDDINSVGASRIEMCYQPSRSTRGIGKVMLSW